MELHFTRSVQYFVSLPSIPYLRLYLFFQTLCAYLFTPVAFLMGIEWDDCFKSAELIGIKVVINEFVAYADLATLIENRKQGLTPAISVSINLCTYC